MRPELLSPAGSPAAMHAAVQNGADAVYLGCGDFNARRNAKNFSQEELRTAVRYCHMRGVKVYLTLNTLLFDREFPAAAQFVAYANDIGIDAVLVQDWGVLRMVHTVAPELPCHASTQMSIHNVDGALAAKALGLTRVVLAREMPREEIAAVCAIDGLETEVFIHGAHCMCYSGQCSMSALIGGRSGNRGTCAQPCRLPYRVDGKTGYPLSLKDMCLAEHIPTLTELGVACVKLEGRMKRAEYVAVVTKIYSTLLRENRAPTAEEQKELAEAFSRNGFTDGYWTGHTGKQMFGVRAQNTPEPKELFEKARETYENEDHFRITADMELTVRQGAASTLTAKDGAGHSVTVTGPVPEEAIHRALNAEDLKERLCKMGGTSYVPGKIVVRLDGGLSLPVSAINGLRRDALEALTECRCKSPVRHTAKYVAEKKVTELPKEPEFTVSVSEMNQLTEALMQQDPVRVYFPIEKLGDLDEKFLGNPALCAVLPRIYHNGESAELQQLLKQAHAKGICQVAVSNLGHMSMAAGLDLTFFGDYGLNVSNSESLLFLRQHGLSSATVSYELRHEQIRDLNKVLPTEAIVYGRLPLMITENDLVRGHNAEDEASMTDRTGAEFPVLPVFGGRSEVENSKILFLADKADYRRLGLAYARLRFTDESPAECAEMLRRYRMFDGIMPKDFTRGLFYRSVE